MLHAPLGVSCSMLGAAPCCHAGLLHILLHHVLVLNVRFCLSCKAFDLAVCCCSPLCRKLIMPLFQMQALWCCSQISRYPSVICNDAEVS